MSYDTEHDFNWFFQTLAPRGQIPGAPPQSLPHVVLDTIRPVVDALGWQRYADVDNIGLLNITSVASTLVNGPATPAGDIRYYFAIEVRHQGVGTHAIWVEYNDATLGNQVSIMRPLLAAPSLVGNGLPQAGVLAKPGDFLTGRAEPTLLAGEVLRLRGFFITLPVSEYIPPRS